MREGELNTFGLIGGVISTHQYCTLFTTRGSGSSVQITNAVLQSDLSLYALAATVLHSSKQAKNAPAGQAKDSTNPPARRENSTTAIAHPTTLHTMHYRPSSRGTSARRVDGPPTHPQTPRPQREHKDYASAGWETVADTVGGGRWSTATPRGSGRRPRALTAPIACGGPTSVDQSNSCEPLYLAQPWARRGRRGRSCP